jgi:hypothetical protein
MSYSPIWITDSLAVGQAPMSHADLDALRRQGVTAVLNLCAEFCDLHWIESEAGFDVYYFPIPDEEAPDLQELEKALDWLDEVIYLGKKALIHCRHGIGRTGTVLNAYLLRKGLGSKMAKKKLSGLRSQPANFDQWWFLRKFGKQEKRLTIREPSLESKNLVDLFPFFADYESIRENVDARLVKLDTGLCGRDHAGCCRSYVESSLIEAVYLLHLMGSELTRPDREAVVARSIAVSKSIRLQSREHADPASFRAAYREADLLCPLNDLGECLIFEDRPLACRLSDLDEAARQELRPKLEEELSRLSRGVFVAYASRFPGEDLPRFPLAQVTSGRFVQAFFHLLLASSKNGEEGTT